MTKELRVCFGSATARSRVQPEVGERDKLGNGLGKYPRKKYARHRGRCDPGSAWKPSRLAMALRTWFNRICKSASSAFNWRIAVSFRSRVCIRLQVGSYFNFAEKLKKQPLARSIIRRHRGGGSKQSSACKRVAKMENCAVAWKSPPLFSNQSVTCRCG